LPRCGAAFVERAAGVLFASVWPGRADDVITYTHVRPCLPTHTHTHTHTHSLVCRADWDDFAQAWARGLFAGSREQGRAFVKVCVRAVCNYCVCAPVSILLCVGQASCQGLCSIPAVA
jgi:hypothetical protein